MFEILILSLVQGVTEFLPISSSSHLIIISEYLNFQNNDLSIDVSLHIGSFIAVITYFHKDFLRFVENRELFLKILVSSIPIIFVGFLLVKTEYIENLRNIQIIGWMTFIFGVLLYISDKFNLEKNIENNFNYKTAIIIGIFQVVSLVPGVSRSGIAITASRILNFKRFDSAKISFLLSIPTLGAVTIYGIQEIVTSDDLNFSVLNIISILLSFIFSLVTMRFFLKYIQNFSLNLFVTYRIILGLGLIYLAYL
tara:strand:- start:173 stop:931 length:759 start_codon:yes stop_codon:yes gene_type:complete